MMGMPARMRGVTLVEMAIVLLILGVLARAVVAPLSAVQAHRQHRDAVSQLETIRNAMWAHVVSRGVLPCPIIMDGMMTTGSRTACNHYAGGVPAAALGLPGPVDGEGALLDPWNRPYRLAISRPGVDRQDSGEPFDWTVEGEASRVGIRQLTADIVVCKQSVSGHCPSKSVRADALSFVVFSLGADDSSAGEQAENLDADQVFVVEEHSVRAEAPFDDLLLWGTAAETIYWMLRAGWLP
ncbi:type II secretion system protein [Granulosicoccus sp. 3-233]|uniref:type II secretion system protein n=1 Tax=Granulosicoccus sp. 3-233 TaxID=3417969 RepID=UPI003D3490D4